MNNEKEKKIVSLLNFASNIFLFLIKFFIGILTGSFALIADSLNSLSDIFSSFIAFFAVKMACEKPDKEHPFGHQRAESIAGLIIGVLVVAIGIEVTKEGFLKLFFNSEIKFGLLALIVLLISILLKVFLAIYSKKSGEKTKSMALIALSKDAFSDALISAAAIIGVIGAINNYLFLDPLMALIISIYVIWNGIKIARENANHLIGKAPSKELIKKIENKAKEIKEIKGVHGIKAQYLGELIQVEIHIEVNEMLSIQEAHLIGKNVQYKIESMKEINRAFVHLDPFK